MRLRLSVKTGKINIKGDITMSFFVRKIWYTVKRNKGEEQNCVSERRFMGKKTAKNRYGVQVEVRGIGKWRVGWF